MEKELILKDPFINLPIQKQVKVSGIQVNVPTKYHGKVLMAVFSISTKKAKKHIRTDKLKPVEIGIGRSLLGITIFDNYSTPVGPYNEVVFSIPILYPAHFSLPLIPLLFKDKLKSFGYFVINIASNTKISREEGKIFGYPHCDKEIDTKLTKNMEHIDVVVMEDGREILTLKVNNAKKESVETIDYNTYFVDNGCLYKIIMNTVGIISKPKSPKDGQLCFSDKGVTAFLSDLDIDRTPVDMFYYRDLIEVLNLPKKLTDV